MFSANGPPKGQNVTSNQSSYDLIYKDVVVNYPPRGISAGVLSKYTISLPNEFDKIYKVELVCANIHFNDIPAIESSIPVNVRNSTIIVSIPQLNNRTLSIANPITTGITQTLDPSSTINNPIINSTNGSNNTAYLADMFCQIPDNYTPLGGGNGTSTYPANSISTFIGGPPFSAEQFYNPPINNINKLDIYLLDVYGNNLLNASVGPNVVDPNGSTNATTNYVGSFYMTLRFYFFQKRNATTAFSTPLFTYAASGTVDSVFSNTRFD